MSSFLDDIEKELEDLDTATNAGMPLDEKRLQSYVPDDEPVLGSLPQAGLMAMGGRPGPGGTTFGDDYNSNQAIVAQVQQAINVAGYHGPDGQPLVVDGLYGDKTAAGVRWIEAGAGIAQDSGIIGDEVLRVLNIVPPASTVTTRVPPGGGVGSVIAVKGTERLAPADLKALYDVATYLGINVDWLATAMSFESGLNPQAVNASSGATGLIQFMPSTAKNLGTTTDALKGMTFQQQLPYVQRYFESHKGQMHNLEDVYLAVFYPAAMGEPPDHVIASAGNPVYDQNAVFDRTKKGYITRADVTSTVTSVLDSAIAAGRRIDIPGLAAFYGAFGPMALWSSTKNFVTAHPYAAAGVGTGILAFIIILAMLGQRGVNRVVSAPAAPSL
jgi:peptidoglycan hydrolase-like protein with peptidoglycan-binding domain